MSIGGSAEDDLLSQENEICALQSIYADNQFFVENGIDDTCRTSMRRVVKTTLTANPDLELHLKFILYPSYPSQSPPIVEISCPALNHEQKSQIYNQLQQLYLDHIGQPVLFIWIEAVRKHLELFSTASAETSASPSFIFDCLETDLMPGKEVEETDSVQLPDIFSGRPITDRKSTFQAHLAFPLTNRAQVAAVLRRLKSCSKVARATHNMYAFRLGSGGAGDCEDDGETHAGGRLLHLLHMMRATDALVVVSRWYGGVHLGADRFKHINNAARLLLEQHGFGGHRKSAVASVEK